MNWLLIILGSYLLGSVPFSHIFPSLKGKDVRKSGTRNVGATNALIVGGPLMGALAVIGDVGKGYLAVSAASYFSLGPWIAVLAGLAVIAGHDFSVFLRFGGGKGVAATAGALLALDPFLGIIVVLLWVLLILVIRYYISSTLIMFLLLPLMMWVLGKGTEFIVFALGALALALYTHREDIKRIISGQELNTSEAVKHYFKK